MTTAVLKNRLLDLTNREFSEAAFGASSLSDFVLKFGDLLHVDQDQSPTVIELHPEGKSRIESEETSSTSGRIRIRSDFWQAVFDRGSNTDYYWLAETGEISTTAIGDNCAVLPTVDEATERLWRQSFAETLPLRSDRIAAWAERLLPITQLSEGQRYQWNRVLTERVNDLLENWFEGQGLVPPPDLVTRIVSPQHKRTTELEPLKRLVKRVVQEMTEDELRNLTLPPRAVLRATKLGRP